MYIIICVNSLLVKKKTENNIDSSTKKIKLRSYITHPPPPHKPQT